MKSAKKIITWVAVSILVILLVLIIGFSIFGAGMIKTSRRKSGQQHPRRAGNG